MNDKPSILDSAEYKASIQRLEDAIRDHHRLVEDFGNEHDMNETGQPEQSMVAGWVLTIGQIGFSEGKEFHAAIVEFPQEMNTFHAIGLNDYARRFLADQTNDYSVLGDD